MGRACSPVSARSQEFVGIGGGAGALAIEVGGVCEGGVHLRRRDGAINGGGALLALGGLVVASLRGGLGAAGLRDDGGGRLAVMAPATAEDDSGEDRAGEQHRSDHEPSARARQAEGEAPWVLAVAVL